MKSRSPLSVAAALVLAAMVGACAAAPGSSAVPGSPAPSAGASAAPPSVAPATSAVPSASSSQPAGASGGASDVGRTQIDWGLIWDALPPSYPHFPGSEPTVTGGGPASAILDIPVAPPTASTWFQDALKTAGFQIIGANGPREDGSYLVEAASSVSCKTEIGLAPLGSTTTATIYVAAACPFS